MRTCSRQCRRLLFVPVLLVATATVVLSAPLQAAAPSIRATPSAVSHAPVSKAVTILPADSGRMPRSFTLTLRAETKEQRVKGLQGSRALMPGEAALFSFDPPQEVTFWMASLTYAIDIIYIDAEGFVTEVFPDCQPESRELFSSRGAVRWVLETAAGSAVRPGDRVRLD